MGSRGQHTSGPKAPLYNPPLEEGNSFGSECVRGLHANSLPLLSRATHRGWRHCLHSARGLSSVHTSRALRLKNGVQSLPAFFVLQVGAGRGGVGVCKIKPPLPVREGFPQPRAANPPRRRAGSACVGVRCGAPELTHEGLRLRGQGDCGIPALGS